MLGVVQVSNDCRGGTGKMHVGFAAEKDSVRGVSMSAVRRCNGGIHAIVDT